MISFKEFFIREQEILSEAFKTPSDMFSDPENNNLTWSEIMTQFKNEGGSVIGTGRSGTVLQHPDWPYVIKFFKIDDSYIRFVRFANKHPNVCFPKFYGNPQLIVPNFKRDKSMEQLVIVRMEYIPHHLRSHEDEKFIIRTLSDIPNYFSIDGPTHSLAKAYLDASKTPEERRTEDEKWIMRHGVYEDRYKRFLKVQKLGEERPELVRLSKAFDMLRNAGMLNDIHKNNVMQRDNGEFVIIDPAWDGAGATPEAIHNYLMSREVGEHLYDPDEYEEKPLLQGGKLFDRRKEKREKERFKREQQREYEKSRKEDDIPF